ncbi:MAG TPA: hypothetical protein VGM74_17600 [Burkholderiaceae bacterium]|jgi:hypothetical protein
MKPVALLTMLLALAAPGAGAETVYRCGSAYSQTPCPQADALELHDERSAAQRADALRVTAAQQRLGDQLQRERLALEAAPKPAAARLDRDPVRPSLRPPPKKVKGWKKPKKPKTAPIPAA